jgi:hypothetical protein
VCLRYPACNAHAPYYIAIFGLPRSTIFLHIISQTERFSGGKVTEHKICLTFVFYFMSETFLILRTIQKDNVKMYIGLHVKYQLLLSDFIAGVHSWGCRLSRRQPWTQASGRQGRYGETCSVLHSPRVEQSKSYLHDGAVRSSETSLNISQTTWRHISRDFCGIYKFASGSRLLSLFALNFALITPSTSSKYFLRRWLWIRWLFSKISREKY